MNEPVKAPTARVDVKDDVPLESILHLAQRVEAEYAEMPGLSVTIPQAQRLLAIDRPTCARVFRTLVKQRILRQTAQGTYVRA